MAEHRVRVGQVYERCGEPAYRLRIRVVAYTPGAGRAEVVDADTGKRSRSILTSFLHASGTTAAGRDRRTGYFLVEDEPDGGAS